jgi:excisionase family DNA binding protein
MEDSNKFAEEIDYKFTRIKEPPEKMTPELFDGYSLERDFMTPLEFAKRFGYNRNTITQWCSEGKLKCIRPGKKIYIYKTEFARLIEVGAGKLTVNGKHDRKKLKHTE